MPRRPHGDDTVDRERESEGSPDRHRHAPRLETPVQSGRVEREGYGGDDSDGDDRYQDVELSFGDAEFGGAPPQPQPQQRTPRSGRTPQRSPHGVDGFPLPGGGGGVGGGAPAQSPPPPRSSPKKRHHHRHHKRAAAGGGGDLKKAMGGDVTSATESETEEDSASSSPPAVGHPVVALVLEDDDHRGDGDGPGGAVDQGDGDVADDEREASTPAQTPTRRMYRSNRRRADSSESGGHGHGRSSRFAPARMHTPPPPRSLTSSFGSSLPSLTGSGGSLVSASSGVGRSSSARSTPTAASSSLSSAAAFPTPRSPRSASPQTPQSCPEYIVDRDRDALLRRSALAAEEIRSPDLYVYCDDDGVARECRPDHDDDDDLEAQRHLHLHRHRRDIVDDVDDIDDDDEQRRRLPRRRIHWASSPPNHRRRGRHSPRAGGRRRPPGGGGPRSPLPDVITTKQPQPQTPSGAGAAFPRRPAPLPLPPSSPSGGGGASLPRLFLSLSVAAFVLAQSYILAVHRGFPPATPGFGSSFGVPLGGDGPFGGNRDLRRALEEERGRILRDIGDFRSGGATTTRGVVGGGGAKFDARLSPRSGRDGLLLRAAAESLRRCPSVGDVRVEGEEESDGGAALAGAAAAGDGPPPREARADAVLLLADDLAPTCEELDRAFAVWSANPDRAVGFFPQRTGPSSSYAAVSDRAVFVHRSVVGSLAHRAASAEAARVVGAAPSPGGEASSSSATSSAAAAARCRDLALSAAASSVASSAPVAVAGRPLRLREEDEESGEYYDPAPCLSRLASVLGVDEFPAEERVYLGGGGGSGR